jgi:serine/threonine-protein kinase
MAPEQTFGEADVDIRADVWAIGAILYECLTGTKAFPGANVGQIFKAVTTGEPADVRQLLPDLPDDIVELIQSMLVKERKHRASDLDGAQAVLGTYASDPERALAMLEMPALIHGHGEGEAAIYLASDAPTAYGLTTGFSTSAATDMGRHVSTHSGISLAAEDFAKQKRRWPWFAAGGALAAIALGALWLVSSGDAAAVSSGQPRPADDVSEAPAPPVAQPAPAQLATTTSETPTKPGNEAHEDVTEEASSKETEGSEEKAAANEAKAKARQAPAPHRYPLPRPVSPAPQAPQPPSDAPAKGEPERLPGGILNQTPF